MNNAIFDVRVASPLSAINGLSVGQMFERLKAAEARTKAAEREQYQLEIKNRHLLDRKVNLQQESKRLAEECETLKDELRTSGHELKRAENVQRDQEESITDLQARVAELKDQKIKFREGHKKKFEALKKRHTRETQEAEKSKNQLKDNLILLNDRIGDFENKQRGHITELKRKEASNSKYKKERMDLLGQLQAMKADGRLSQEFLQVMDSNEHLCASISFDVLLALNVSDELKTFLLARLSRGMRKRESIFNDFIEKVVREGYFEIIVEIFCHHTVCGDKECGQCLDCKGLTLAQKKCCFDIFVFTFNRMPMPSDAENASYFLVHLEYLLKHLDNPLKEYEMSCKIKADALSEYLLPNGSYLDAVKSYIKEMAASEANGTGLKINCLAAIVSNLIIKCTIYMIATCPEGWNGKFAKRICYYSTRLDERVKRRDGVLGNKEQYEKMLAYIYGASNSLGDIQVFLDTVLEGDLSSYASCHINAVRFAHNCVKALRDLIYGRTHLKR